MAQGEVKGTVLPSWLEDAYFDVVRSKPVRALFPSASDLATSASLGWNQAEGKSIPGMMAGAALETFGIPGIGYFGSRMAEQPVARFVDEFLPVERMVRRPEYFNIYHGTMNASDLANIGPRRHSPGNIYVDGFHGTGSNYLANQYAGTTPGGAVGMFTGRMDRPFDLRKEYALSDIKNMLKPVQKENYIAKQLLEKDFKDLPNNTTLSGDTVLDYMKFAQNPETGMWGGHGPATDLLDKLGFDGVIVNRKGLGDIQIFMQPEKQLSPGWSGKFQPGPVKF